MSIIQYRSVNGTATITEAHTTVNVKSVKLIANDATSGDLHISLGSSITEGNYIVLKPGEQMTNIETVSCDELYYKSSTGSVAFRFVGLTGLTAVG